MGMATNIIKEEGSRKGATNVAQLLNGTVIMLTKTALSLFAIGEKIIGNTTKLKCSRLFRGRAMAALILTDLTILI